jgi:hypothetical protein
VDSEEMARSNIELFRSRASSAGFYFLCFIFVGLVVESIVSSELRAIFISCAWATAAICIFYALMHKPKIVVFDEGLEIVNPISRHIISWSEVRTIDTRFSLSVTTNNGKKIHAWAAPAPGRYHARRLHSSDFRGTKMEMGGSIRAGESPKSESGAAFMLISTRFDNFNLHAAQFGRNTHGVLKRDWTLVAVTTAAILALIILQ